MSTGPVGTAKFFCIAIISRNLCKQVENSANGIKFERKNGKNDKMSKCEKWKRKKWKNKNWKYVKKMFLAKFWAKIIFWGRNLSFQSLPGHQNMKDFAVNNMATSRWSKIEKHIDFFYIFSVPRWTIRGHQWIDLDLSCSELFFRVPCDSYSVLNDLICFCHFSRF